MNQEHYPVYLKYTFGIIPEHMEILVAELSTLGFESFEEHADKLDAYIPEDQLTDPIRRVLSGAAGKSFKLLGSERIAHQNWNAQWEAGFKPIVIGKFCSIRATFHAPLKGVTHELIIDPKMAFGTGHHETTWMMISEMQNMDLKDRKVLDYGAGTGILAILAEKLGAIHVDALEVDLQAIDNIQLNLELNHSTAVTCLHGDINKVKHNRYEITLANINRTVILESLEILQKMTIEGGKILFSGILESDQHLVSESIVKSGFHILHIRQRGEWICIRALK